MNSPLHTTRGIRRCLIAAACLFMAQAASAFFIFPNPMWLFKGQTITVTIKGSSKTANIVVNSVNHGSEVTTNFMGPLSGEGEVTISLTAVSTGPVFLSASGTQQIGTGPVQPKSGFASGYVFEDSLALANAPLVAFAGDPVNTSNGEFAADEAVDLNLGGPQTLRFVRCVSSVAPAAAGAIARMGTARMHNFASKIILNQTLNGVPSIQIVLPKGRLLTFQKKGTKWILLRPLDLVYTLVESGTDFLLGMPDTKQIWIYNANGELTRIEDGKGNAHTLTYVGGFLTQISDGLGRTITLTYTSNLVSKVTDHNGLEVTYTYTGGVLTSVKDISGVDTTTYGNSGGLPISVTRPMGNLVLSQTYTAGKVTGQVERGTDNSSLSYQPGVTTFTDAQGGEIVDEYNAAGQLTRHVDQGDKAMVMTYDSAAHRTSVTDRMGAKTTLTYHALSGLPATVTNALGGVTTFAYKSRTLSGITFYDLSKVTAPDGSSRAYSYDAKGNVTQISDEAGKNWKYTYNANGQVLTATNPLGGVTTYTYNAAGNTASIQGPDVGLTTYAYDSRNRLNLITRPGGATVTTTYDTKNRVSTIVDEGTNTYTYTYDANDRLLTVTDPANKVTTFGYDVLDRVNQVIDRLGKTSSVTFDSRRQLASSTDGNGNTTTFEYDPRQRLTGVTNPGTEEWSIGYDDEGLPISFANPIDQPGTIKRNALGQPVEIRDPMGHTTFLTRDPVQRVTRVFDPMGRQTLYGYDKRGFLISATEQGTGTAKYDRDALGALSKITDPGGASWAFTYTKGGLLASVTDPLGKKTTHIHDDQGRLSSTTRPDATTVTRTYDASSNLTQINFSAGPVINYGYDSLHRPISTTGLDFTYDAEGRIINARQNSKDFDATYDNGGRLQTVSYFDDAVVVTYQYDTRNRLTQVVDDKTTVIVSFVYDDADRLTQINRSNGVTTFMEYDAAGRLDRIHAQNLTLTTLVDLDYRLNAAGDVASVDFTGLNPAVAAAPPELFKFNKASQVINTGYSYDVLGRLTAAPSRTFGWDGASRLTNANGVTLAYNGLNEVMLRTDGPKVTRFYRHHALGMAPIVYENPESGGGNAQVYVWTPAGELLYSFDAVTLLPRFYHFDRVGSTLALTDVAGLVTDTYAYGPFGEDLGRTGSSDQPFKYVGAWGVRAEGGLYDMRARYYDPVTARFLSRDPAVPDLTSPAELNPYQYALNNPLTYLDPQGTFPVGSQSVLNERLQNTRRSMSSTRHSRRKKSDIMHVLDSCMPTDRIFLSTPGICGGGTPTGSFIINVFPSGPAPTQTFGDYAGAGGCPLPADPFDVREAFDEIRLPFPPSPGCDFPGPPGSCGNINWGPIEDLLFRGSWAEGFRAPSIGELFGTPSRFDQVPQDPVVTPPATPTTPSSPPGNVGKPKPNTADPSFYFSKGGAADVGEGQVLINGGFNR